MQRKLQKSVLQVCTLRHIAARRMSPSAMFLRTPAAAHDARRSGNKKPLHRGTELSRSSPRGLVNELQSKFPGVWLKLGRLGGLSAPTRSTPENSTIATATLAA